MKRAKNRCPACTKLQLQLEKQRAASERDSKKTKSSGLASANGAWRKTAVPEREVPTVAKANTAAAGVDGVSSAQSTSKKNEYDIAGWESAQQTHQQRAKKEDRQQQEAESTNGDHDGADNHEKSRRGFSRGTASVDSHAAPSPEHAETKSSRRAVEAESSQNDDVECNHCLCRDSSHGVDETGQPRCGAQLAVKKAPQC